jgi:hypothetical protein
MDSNTTTELLKGGGDEEDLNNNLDKNCNFVMGVRSGLPVYGPLTEASGYISDDEDLQDREVPYTLYHIPYTLYPTPYF